jgi:UPF0176 protein
MMDQKNTYFVLAYYIFTPIEDPQAEVSRHLDFIEKRDITCRVYISEEGINGQMSASAEAAEQYMEWLKSDPRFASVAFKLHPHHEHVFPRPSVKYRKQLVAMDEKIDFSQTGTHVAPEEWKQMLIDRDENTVLIDVRNDYEWKIGHFEGAELPQLDTFRRFPDYARQLKEQRDPASTKVMMYCTGGIRCELYSALLKKEGFENVFQLDGGVINYGLKEGNDLWRGKLFVFDDRLAVPIDGRDAETISSCCHCDQPSDVYYNCANMDCNELFLCCPACAEEFQGCCCAECRSAPRLRPFEKGDRPKPFRRKHLISQSSPAAS